MRYKIIVPQNYFKVSCASHHTVREMFSSLHSEPEYRLRNYRIGRSGLVPEKEINPVNPDSTWNI